MIQESLTQTPSEKNPHAPIFQERMGTISVAVFENVYSKDGKSFSKLSITAQRSYKDATGNWKHSNSFGVNDIPKLRECLHSVWVKCFEKRNSEEIE